MKKKNYTQDQPLIVATLAHRQATESFHSQAFSEFCRQIPGHFLHSMNEPSRADILLFLTGGSEAQALKRFEPNHFALLVAGFHDNAWAAATEVKAWADANGMISALVPFDNKKETLLEYICIMQLIRELYGKRLGLSGGVSEWLVASGVSAARLKELLGMDLLPFDWDEMSDFSQFEPDPLFLKEFSGRESLLNAKAQASALLDNEARIHAMLTDHIQQNQLYGISLSCFDLVSQRRHSPCLSLAMLNDRGIVAACEGDLVSLTGMIIGKAVFGQIPWMANMAALDDEGVLFAHCTAPLGLLRQYRLNTHFETGCSAAIEGEFDAEEITVFRMNAGLNRAFLSQARIVERPRHDYGCRSQIKAIFPERALKLLREQPLGNHHLVFAGNLEQKLALVCRVLGVERQL